MQIFSFSIILQLRKEVLSNIIDRFEERITELGYEYIFESEFKDLIAKSILENF